jgi:hypothetical protein
LILIDSAKLNKGFQLPKPDGNLEMLTMAGIFFAGHETNFTV